MPRTEVVFFREQSGTVALVDWLATLPPVARARCRIAAALNKRVEIRFVSLKGKRAA